MKNITSRAALCSLVLITAAGCAKLDEKLYGSKSLYGNGAPDQPNLMVFIHNYTDKQTRLILMHYRSTQRMK
jgi:hypothetical protein